jgi:predicted PurR-regulated permease PerM
LIEALPKAIAAAGERVQFYLGQLEARLHPAAYERLQSIIQGVQQDPSAITTRIGEWLTQGIFGLVNIGSTLIGLMIVPFFVYYLLLDSHTIARNIEERFPPRHRDVGRRLMHEVGDVVRGYVRGRAIMAAAMSVFYAVGLLVLGIPLWAAIGLVAGFVGIIPYLGVITGIVLALAFAALDGAGLATMVGIIVIFILAQLLEDYVLTPKLIGDRLELHPMLVFIALIIAGDMFGLLGLVIAIPVLGVLKVIVRFLDQLYLRSAFYDPELATVGPVLLQRATDATVSDDAVVSDMRRARAMREDPRIDHSDEIGAEPAGVVSVAADAPVLQVDEDPDSGRPEA